MKKILLFLLTLQCLTPLLQAKSSAREREQAALAYLQSLEEESPPQTPEKKEKAKPKSNPKNEDVEDSLTGEEKVLLGATVLGCLAIVGGLVASIATSDAVGAVKSGVYNIFYTKPKPTSWQRFKRSAEKKIWEYQEKIDGMSADEIKEFLLTSSMVFLYGGIVIAIIYNVLWSTGTQNAGLDGRKSFEPNTRRHNPYNGYSDWGEELRKSMDEILTRQAMESFRRAQRDDQASQQAAQARKMVEQNAWRLLGVPEHSSAGKILGVSMSIPNWQRRRTALNRLREYHPDRWTADRQYGPDGLRATAEEINEACTVLNRAWEVFK